MRLLGVALLLGLCSFSIGQNFTGDISGKMVENDFESEFTWRFEGDKTTYILEFELEHEEHRVEITFDGDTTANVEIYEDGKLAESRPFYPSQDKSEIVVIDKQSSTGGELLGYSTDEYQIRTEDREIETSLADIKVDWNGAEYFFIQDIPFAIASEQDGKFPLKIMSTDLMGELKYSFVVESVTKK